MTAVPVSAPVTRLSRLQGSPLWAALTVVFAGEPDAAYRAAAFLNPACPFGSKAAALLRRLGKRRCGDRTCLCDAPFDSHDEAAALLTAAFGGTLEEAAYALSDLEKGIDDCIRRLSTKFTCAACTAYHARHRSRTPRKRRTSVYDDSGY